MTVGVLKRNPDREGGEIVTISLRHATGEPAGASGTFLII